MTEKKYRLERNEYGLTQNEVQVLECLETPSYSDIAVRLGISKQRVGQIVSSLKKKQMVDKIGNRIVASDAARPLLDGERRRRAEQKEV